MCTININALEMDRQVFWQINYLQSQKLIHGCHEAVAGIQLKPTMNYWRSIQDIKTYSIFKKKSSPQ